MTVNMRIQDYIEKWHPHDARNFIAPEEPPTPPDEEILKSDAERLASFNQTPQKIATKVSMIFMEAELNASSDTVIVQRILQVSGIGADDVASSKCSNCAYIIHRDFQYTITNLENKKSVTISNLQLHRLKEHSYFGEKEERVEPALLCEVLGLIRA